MPSTTAYVPYCTSDCYTGTRNASSETDGLIFHGKYVVKAVLEANFRCATTRHFY